jgi:hypothetical protein
MAAKVYDINTTGETIGTTLHGQLFTPLRYTETDDDTVRVSVWQDLSTRIGSDPLAIERGLDHEDMLDGGTSDEERSAMVTEVVLANPGVAAVTQEPTVVVSEGGQLVSIAVEARTIYGGTVSLVA